MIKKRVGQRMRTPRNSSRTVSNNPRNDSTSDASSLCCPCTPMTATASIDCCTPTGSDDDNLPVSLSDRLVSRREKEEVKLRHSCESCIRSKVKCSSGKPFCERCIKRGINCTYLPEKKRGKKGSGKSKPKKTNSNPSLQDHKHKLIETDVYKPEISSQKPIYQFKLPDSRHIHDPMFAIGARENFAWNLISRFLKIIMDQHKAGPGCQPLSLDLLRNIRSFQLHCRIKSSRKWSSLFSRQLSKLDSILESEELDMDKIIRRMNDRVRKCDDYEENRDEAIARFRRPDLHLNRSSQGVPVNKAGNRIISTVKNLVQPVSDSDNLPMVTLRSEVSDLTNGSERRFNVSLNPAFTKVFGKTEEDVELQLKDTVVGFLPYGAGLLSLLADETQVMSFLEVQCLKVKQTGVNCSKVLKGLKSEGEVICHPMVFEVPSVVTVTANIKRSIYDTDTIPSPFLLTVVNRKITDGFFTQDEISMQFKPMEDLSHLLEVETSIYPEHKKLKMDHDEESKHAFDEPDFELTKTFSFNSLFDIGGGLDQKSFDKAIDELAGLDDLFA